MELKYKHHRDPSIVKLIDHAHAAAGSHYHILALHVSCWQ